MGIGAGPRSQPGQRPSKNLVTNLSIECGIQLTCRRRVSEKREAQFNANVEGNATQSLSDIWGTYGLFYVKDPAQRPRTVCFGRNFVVNKFTTFEYEDEERGGPEGRVRVIESSWEYVMKNTTLDSQTGAKIGAGYLLQGII